MQSTRITSEDEANSDRGRFLAKVEEAAMQLFKDHGMKVMKVHFTWTKNQIKQGDEMNDQGLKENEQIVEATYVDIN